jgi:hypothetical protein
LEHLFTTEKVAALAPVAKQAAIKRTRAELVVPADAAIAVALTLIRAYCTLCSWTRKRVVGVVSSGSMHIYRCPSLRGGRGALDPKCQYRWRFPTRKMHALYVNQIM